MLQSKTPTVVETQTPDVYRKTFSFSFFSTPSPRVFKIPQEVYLYSKWVYDLCNLPENPYSKPSQIEISYSKPRDTKIYARNKFLKKNRIKEDFIFLQKTVFEDCNWALYLDSPVFLLVIVLLISVDSPDKWFFCWRILYCGRAILGYDFCFEGKFI